MIFLFLLYNFAVCTDVTHIRKLRLKMYNEMQESQLKAWCGGTGIIAVIRLKKHCKIALGKSILSCLWSVKKQWMILGDRQLNYFTVKGDRYKCIHQSSSNKSELCEWVSRVRMSTVFPLALSLFYSFPARNNLANYLQESNCQDKFLCKNVKKYIYLL